jgi:predicted transcriptional regulator
VEDFRVLKELKRAGGELGYKALATVLNLERSEERKLDRILKKLIHDGRVERLVYPSKSRPRVSYRLLPRRERFLDDDLDALLRPCLETFMLGLQESMSAEERVYSTRRLLESAFPYLYMPEAVESLIEWLVDHGVPNTPAPDYRDALDRPHWYPCRVGMTVTPNSDPTTTRCSCGPQPSERRRMPSPAAARSGQGS